MTPNLIGALYATDMAPSAVPLGSLVINPHGHPQTSLPIHAGHVKGRVSCGGPKCQRERRANLLKRSLWV